MIKEDKALKNRRKQHYTDVEKLIHQFNNLYKRLTLPDAMANPYDCTKIKDIVIAVISKIKRYLYPSGLKGGDPILAQIKIDLQMPPAPDDLSELSEHESIWLRKFSWHDFSTIEERVVQLKIEHFPSSIDAIKSISSPHIPVASIMGNLLMILDQVQDLLIGAGFICHDSYNQYIDPESYSIRSIYRGINLVIRSVQRISSLSSLGVS